MNRTEYKNRFNEEHYERIIFSVPKDTKMVIKDLASEKGLSMNKYILVLVRKDQGGMFDSMQLAEKNKDKILSIKGNMHNGYDVFLKDDQVFHCRAKLEVRKLFSKSLTQDTTISPCCFVTNVLLTDIFLRK